MRKKLKAIGRRILEHMRGIDQQVIHISTKYSELQKRGKWGLGIRDTCKPFLSLETGITPDMVPEGLPESHLLTGPSRGGLGQEQAEGIIKSLFDLSNDECR